MDLGFGPGRKSPTVARLLSIIPGLGHFYAGEYFTGIILLIIFVPLLFLGHLFSSFFPEMKYCSTQISGAGFIFYGLAVFFSAREASSIVADNNARKAAQERFAAEKMALQDLRKLEEEPRKD